MRVITVSISSAYNYASTHSTFSKPVIACSTRLVLCDTRHCINKKNSRTYALLRVSLILINFEFRFNIVHNFVRKNYKPVKDPVA